MVLTRMRNNSNNGTYNKQHSTNAAASWIIWHVLLHRRRNRRRKKNKIETTRKEGQNNPTLPHRREREKDGRGGKREGEVFIDTLARNAFLYLFLISSVRYFRDHTTICHTRQYHPALTMMFPMTMMMTDQWRCKLTLFPHNISPRSPQNLK